MKDHQVMALLALWLIRDYGDALLMPDAILMAHGLLRRCREVWAEGEAPVERTTP